MFYFVLRFRVGELCIFFTTDLYCVKKSAPSVKIFIGHISLCDNTIVASAR